MSRQQKRDEAWRACLCGSGKPREAQYDARGIFLTYTCSRCEKEKLSHYRSDVLTDPGYWHDEPIEEDD
jgi:hypothetical protein